MFLQQDSSIWFVTKFLDYLVLVSWLPKWCCTQFQLVEWAIIQIRYQLVTSAIFVSQFYQYVLKADYHCILKVWQLNWCLTSSFCGVQTTIWYHGHLTVEVKSLCRHLLNSSVLNVLSGCCFQPSAFTVCLWRTYKQQLGFFGSSHGSLCPTI